MNKKEKPLMLVAQEPYSFAAFYEFMGKHWLEPLFTALPKDHDPTTEEMDGAMAEAIANFITKAKDSKEIKRIMEKHKKLHEQKRSCHNNVHRL